VALDRTQSGAAKKGSVEEAIEIGVYAFHSDDTKPYDKGVVQSVSKGWVRLQPPGEDGEAFSVQRSSITAMFKRKPRNWEAGKDDIHVAGVLAALPGAVTTGLTDDDRECGLSLGDDDGDEEGAHESQCEASSDESYHDDDDSTLRDKRAPAAASKKSAKRKQLRVDVYAGGSRFGLKNTKLRVAHFSHLHVFFSLAGFVNGKMRSDASKIGTVTVKAGDGDDDDVWGWGAGHFRTTNKLIDNIVNDMVQVKKLKERLFPGIVYGVPRKKGKKKPGEDETTWMTRVHLDVITNDDALAQYLESTDDPMLVIDAVLAGEAAPASKSTPAEMGGAVDGIHAGGGGSSSAQVTGHASGADVRGDRAPAAGGAGSIPHAVDVYVGIDEKGRCSAKGPHFLIHDGIDGEAMYSALTSVDDLRRLVAVGLSDKEFSLHATKKSIHLMSIKSDGMVYAHLGTSTTIYSDRDLVGAYTSQQGGSRMVLTVAVHEADEARDDSGDKAPSSHGSRGGRSARWTGPDASAPSPDGTVPNDNLMTSVRLRVEEMHRTLGSTNQALISQHVGRIFMLRVQDNFLAGSDQGWGSDGAGQELKAKVLNDRSAVASSVAPSVAAAPAPPGFSSFVSPSGTAGSVAGQHPSVPQHQPAMMQLQYPHQQTVDLPPLPLARGWQQVTDPRDGVVYYYNRDTNESSWERPLPPRPPGPPPGVPPLPPRPPGAAPAPALAVATTVQAQPAASFTGPAMPPATTCAPYGPSGGSFGGSQADG